MQTMNELTTTARLEEIAVGIEAHTKTAAEQILYNGKLLCEARELLKSDPQFGQWREKRLSWMTDETARRWMNAFRNNGEYLLQHNVGVTSVYLLTAPSVPESARAEALERAESGEKLTVKATEEIVARHKAELAAMEERAKVAEEGRKAVQLQLDQALEAAKPNQDRLIRELRLKRKGGGISEAEANALSLLPEDLQRVQYERLRRGEVLELDKQAAERTAAQAVENQQQALAAAQQARAEAEEAKRRADELAREGAQSMIDDLNKQIETLNKQLAREKETAWEEGKNAGLKSAAEAQQAAEAELRQKIAALEKEKAAILRQNSALEGRVSVMAQESRVLEARARGAEEQLESAHPLAKDNIHAGVISHMTEDLRATLAKLEADCEQHQRKLSDQALQKMAAVLDQYLVKNSFFEGEVIG